MAAPLPQLPPELLDLILREAFPPAEQSTNAFHRVRDPAEERSLYRWSLSSGRSWLPFLRSLLFFSPHVGSRSRADRLSLALRLAFPGDEMSKGYLTSLVKRLSLDIRERELLKEQDRHGKYKGADGVSPLQVAELAKLLPKLEQLDIAAADKGAWAGDPSMLNAFRRFKNVKELEVTGNMGWQYILAVAVKLEKLVSFKVKAAQPDWNFAMETYKEGAAFASSFSPSTPYPFSQTLTTLVLWDCCLAPTEFTTLFASLAPAAHLPATAQPVGGVDALPPPSLRRLTIHHLRQPSEGNAFLAFSPIALISHLSPLVPHLQTLHLVLFERPILAHADLRGALAATGRLKEGHITSLPDSGERPGNALAALLGPQAQSLTLGGPFCVAGPALYDALDAAAARPDGGRMKSLKLQLCADVGRPGEGLKPDEFVSALDREWATQLERLDVELMQYAQPADEEKPAWGEKQLEALKAKAAQVSSERAKQGALAGPLGVVCDEDAVKREREEREFYERRKKRSRTKSSGGRGGKAATSEKDRDRGVSGEKRRKTKE
ncbi:hypothetical protein JCM10213_000141 [Rhodosporidiobolus nylandii]